MITNILDTCSEQQQVIAKEVKFLFDRSVDVVTASNAKAKAMLNEINDFFSRANAAMELLKRVIVDIPLWLTSLTTLGLGLYGTFWALFTGVCVSGVTVGVVSLLLVTMGVITMVQKITQYYQTSVQNALQKELDDIRSGILCAQDLNKRKTSLVAELERNLDDLSQMIGEQEQFTVEVRNECQDGLELVHKAQDAIQANHTLNLIAIKSMIKKIQQSLDLVDGINQKIAEIDKASDLVDKAVTDNSLSHNARSVKLKEYAELTKAIIPELQNQFGMLTDTQVDALDTISTMRANNDEMAQCVKLYLKEIEATFKSMEIAAQQQLKAEQAKRTTLEQACQTARSIQGLIEQQDGILGDMNNTLERSYEKASGKNGSNTWGNTAGICTGAAIGATFGPVSAAVGATAGSKLPTAVGAMASYLFKPKGDFVKLGNDIWLEYDSTSTGVLGRVRGKSSKTAGTLKIIVGDKLVVVPFNFNNRHLKDEHGKSLDAIRPAGIYNLFMAIRSNILNNPSAEPSRISGNKALELWATLANMQTPDSNKPSFVSADNTMYKVCQGMLKEIVQNHPELSESVDNQGALPELGSDYDHVESDHVSAKTGIEDDYEMI